MRAIPASLVSLLLLVGGCQSHAPTSSALPDAAASGRGGFSAPMTGGGGAAGNPILGESGMGGSAGSAAEGGSGSGGVSGSAGQAGMGGQAGSGGQGTMPIDMGPLFPPNGGKDLCPDPTLRMHFSAPPSVASAGTISVFKTSAPAAPVAVVNLGAATVTEMLAGTSFTLPRPVYVDGNDVIIRLPPHSLTYGQSYYVTVDAGAVKGPGGMSMTIAGMTDWQFSTVAAAPTDLTALRVAVDGTGQFCSVQGALDALPANNTAASTITIGKATYFETVHVASKNNITLHGEDRKATIILGVNNNNLNPNTVGRSLVGIDRSQGFVIENLTIHNLTPQDGSQAEALRMQTCDQCIVRHADILSLQDTLLWSGRVYANDDYIAGNVDFIWGTGIAMFEQCEIKTVGRAGVVVQSRNATTGYGYVFVDSKITADANITNTMLGRIDASAYPGSHVAYINCQMGSFIAPTGWTITGGLAGPSLRFWEYQSTDAAGMPLDVSRRVAGSKQISADDAMKMRDPSQVFGGWTPAK